MNSGTARALLILVVALASAGCLGAMQTTAHEPAGVADLKPAVEDRDAGLVGIAPGFDLKRYTVVAVERFPVTGKVNDNADRRMAEKMPDYLLTEVVRQLRSTGLFTRVVNTAEATFSPGAESTLRLQGRISSLDPGSRALRYWVGFGAGRSKAQVEFHFVDTATGRTVLVTADRRVAAYGVWGGDSEEHLRESFNDMARDLGRFLDRLSRGEAPRPK
jgi:hypothetical protein